MCFVDQMNNNKKIHGNPSGTQIKVFLIKIATENADIFYQIIFVIYLTMSLANVYISVNFKNADATPIFKECEENIYIPPNMTLSQ